MSIIRIAVENHLVRNRMTIRELLEAAYYHRYERYIPHDLLAKDIERWENGENNIPYLYELMLPSCS